MNPLARIKEKLMVKPNVEERERVAVVIKGVKKPRIQRAPKTTVPAPLIIVFTELVLPLLAVLVPKRTVVVAPAAFVNVTVDPAPPLMPKASKVTPEPVMLRLTLLSMETVFVPVRVESLPVSLRPVLVPVKV